ncbi:Mechanosensory protein 2 [Sarcoptes scabiei]|nr:Mechanosensory protein 2 [Sarcoptes scabiei]
MMNSLLQIDSLKSIDSNESFHRFSIDRRSLNEIIATNSFETFAPLLIDNQWRYPPLWTISLCFAYTSVFIIGLLGNGAVLWVMYTLRYNSPQSMSTNSNTNIFNYFICNLAIADLLVIIFCLFPNLLGSILTNWILGRFVCKAVTYLQGVSVSASIYTLVAISIDRFYGIHQPFQNGFSQLAR